MAFSHGDAGPRCQMGDKVASANRDSPTQFLRRVIWGRVSTVWSRPERPGQPPHLYRTEDLRAGMERILARCFAVSVPRKPSPTVARLLYHLYGRRSDSGGARQRRASACLPELRDKLRGASHADTRPGSSSHHDAPRCKDGGRSCRGKGPHSSGNPALRKPTKYVFSNSARISRTPGY